MIKINREPLSAKILLAVRAAVCLELLYVIHFGKHSFPASFLDLPHLEPIYQTKSLFALFSIPLPSSQTYLICKSLFSLGLLFMMTGVFSRYFYIATSLLGPFVVGLLTQFGYESHLVSPILMMMVFFSFMKLPSIFEYAKSEAVREEKKSSYRFYLNCLKLIWISVFFNAGIEKLKHSGIEYLITDKHFNTLIIARVFHSNFASAEFISIVKYVLLDLKVIYAFGAAVAFELITPLALFKFRGNVLIVLAMLFMNLMIYLLIGLPHIFYFIPLYMIFLDEKKGPLQAL